MSDTPKDIKIVFAPGVLDQLTQEDIDEITATVRAAIADGTLESHATPIDDSDRESIEEQFGMSLDQMLASFMSDENKKRLH